ncbi:ABC-three component system middle component 6 [Aeromonas salmonicida]|uniref:ABC-three component system middle component 6 n=1 Tax=Aeromonas salmonicida TaxID=645 RepID=UPI002FEE6538
MILSKASPPNKYLYIIGANIISILNDNENRAMPPISLYERYNSQYKPISLSYIIYGLDWLFIISVICLSETGDVKLCN